MDSTKPKETAPYHRNKELETIGKLPDVLKNSTQISLGVHSLVDMIMRTYISRYNGKCLKAIKSSLEEEITKLGSIVQTKSKTTDPSVEALKIVNSLGKNEDNVGVCEGRCIRKVLDDAFGTFVKTSDFGNVAPESGILGNIFGTTKKQNALANENKARTLMEEFMKGLCLRSTDVVELFIVEYEKFLDSTIEDYRHTCRPLHDAVKQCYRDYIEGARRVLENDINKFFVRASRLTSIKNTNKAYPLPGSTFLGKTEVGKDFSNIMGPTYDHIVRSVIDTLSDVYSEFPVAMNARLTNMGVTWKNATEEEIECLRKEIVLLRAKVHQVEKIVSKFDNI